MANKRIRKKKQKEATGGFSVAEVKEYKRIRKNTLAKIDRVYENYGIDVTSDIKVPKLEDFQSKEELHEWEKEMKWFTDKANRRYQFVKNKKGVVASKEYLDHAEKVNKQAQEATEKLFEEYKDAPYYSGQKRRGTVGSELPKMGEPNLAGIIRPVDFNFDAIETQQRLFAKVEGMERRASGEYFDERNATMRDNFVYVLRQTFNSEAEDVAEIIEKMNPDDFFEMYLMFDEISFNYYASEQVEAFSNNKDNLRAVESYVKAYNRGLIDTSLKRFPNG